jgi:GTP-binding protein
VTSLANPSTFDVLEIMVGGSKSPGGREKHATATKLPPQSRKNEYNGAYPPCTRSPPGVVDLKAEFVLSANKPEHFPTDGLPEVAFLGRSNVGKSSLINAITGITGLAFTSNTPGRTQSINFYRIDDSFYFVDLPGYGYAKVPLASKQEWARLIESYLKERKTLEMSFLILDARRGWMDKDLDLKEWLEANNHPFRVVASKIDKLNQSEQSHSVKNIRKYAEPLPFSAITGRGVREIWQAISKTNPPRK